MNEKPPLPVLRTIVDTVILATFVAVILAIGGIAQLLTGGHW